MAYNFGPEAWENAIPEVLPAYAQASEALVRLDERLRNDPLAEGLRQRLHFAEVVAITREEGDLIELQDLVLRDAGIATRIGDIPLARALVTLRARRLAEYRNPAWGLSDEGLAALAGVNTEADASRHTGPSAMLAPDEDAFPKLKAWRNGLRLLDSEPALLAAAIAYAHWCVAPPLLRNPAIGGLLVACYMRRRGIARHHLPAITLGIRAAGYRPLALRSTAERLRGFIDAVARGAEFGVKELARLSNAREIMALRLKGRRKSSHLPALADLLLSRPVVTIPMAARALGISQRAVAALLPQLGSTPRELTDRDSYRAWGI